MGRRAEHVESGAECTTVEIACMIRQKGCLLYVAELVSRHMSLLALQNLEHNAVRKKLLSVEALGSVENVPFARERLSKLKS